MGNHYCPQNRTAFIFILNPFPDLNHHNDLGPVPCPREATPWYFQMLGIQMKQFSYSIPQVSCQCGYDSSLKTKPNQTNQPKNKTRKNFPCFFFSYLFPFSPPPPHQLQSPCPFVAQASLELAPILFPSDFLGLGLQACAITHCSNYSFSNASTYLSQHLPFRLQPLLEEDGIYLQEDGLLQSECLRQIPVQKECPGRPCLLTAYLTPVPPCIPLTDISCPSRQGEA